MKDRFNLYRFASPAVFYPLAGAMIPYFTAVAVVFGLAGLWLGMLVAPTDFQQGEGYRIIFIHVPASWMSMFIYLVMAFWAAIGLAFNTRLSGMMAQALAPTGALMAFLSLLTGALWGKPMWGAWWVWDARLTSELILLFLYIGYMALTAAIDDARRADKAGALLLLVGVVNIPIIYFSVKWWNTLHQGLQHQSGKIIDGDHHAMGHAADGHVLLDVLHRRRLDARAHHHARTRTQHRMGQKSAHRG
jgi:heme exporter protein C